VEVLDRMRGPVFDRARTPEGFAEVQVDPESGTVVWPGGLAPDTMYERARTGAWPDHDVAADQGQTVRVAGAGFPQAPQTPRI
jgi:hypothetical protein